MNSKNELRRLGGLESALTMLESPKASVVDSAAMVIANCSQNDEEFCVALMRSGTDKLKLLVGLLESECLAPTFRRRWDRDTSSRCRQLAAG